MSTSFARELMAPFEVDEEGRSRRWRDSYDAESITGQLTAAGSRAPA
ncbi:MAG TPA: hypothetical protein VIX84_08850 [Acidimicrobiales bacterium]